MTVSAMLSAVTPIGTRAKYGTMPSPSGDSAGSPDAASMPMSEKSNSLSTLEMSSPFRSASATAAATAAFRVLVALFPNQLPTLQPLYDASLAAIRVARWMTAIENADGARGEDVLRAVVLPVRSDDRYASDRSKSPGGKALLEKLNKFMDEVIYPAEPVYEEQMEKAKDRWQLPKVIEEAVRGRGLPVLGWREDFSDALNTVEARGNLVVKGEGIPGESPGACPECNRRVAGIRRVQSFCSPL